MNYLIGITSYDNDNELWETHVGNDAMELLYSVWGKTENESKANAFKIISLIENSVPKFDLE